MTNIVSTFEELKRASKIIWMLQGTKSCYFSIHSFNKRFFVLPRNQVRSGYQLCFSCSCRYLIFNSLRLCRFSTNRKENSHILMTTFCIRPLWQIFDLGSN